MVSTETIMVSATSSRWRTTELQVLVELRVYFWLSGPRCQSIASFMMLALI